MASLVVEEEDLSSLDREDMFIADTTKLARLFFELEHKRKIVIQEAKTSSKGVGQSRSLPEAVADEDKPHLAAAVYVGRRLCQIAEAHNNTLTQAFGEYVAGVAHTIYDLNYDIFRRIMSDVVDALPNQSDQVVLTFAGGLHISEALREVGNDGDRQNEFASYVGRFIVHHGLMPLIEQRGGWEQAFADGTPV